MILEATVAMGFAAVLALVMMKASMIGLTGNQWTIMQTLTDAYLTRETALANRLPVADLTATTSQWPDPTVDTPQRYETTVTLGKLPGGAAVLGNLVRFRTNETQQDDATTASSVYRLYSILSYQIGDKEYFKSRSTLRLQ
ncbi:MAG: hypothetical protein U0984_09295 [Prosthecobacter sp.]|nr:hypothetical protein [Prosthecobacter sp.]